MALKDILDNKELSDDQEITAGNSTIKLGELRSAFNAAPPADKFVRREEYDSMRQRKEQFEAGTLSLLQRAAEAADHVPEPVQPTDSKAAFREVLSSLLKEEQGYDYDKDGYVGPAMRKVRAEAEQSALDRVAGVFRPAFEGLKNQIDGLTARQALQQERMWYKVNYADIPADANGNKLSLDQLRQAALQYRVVDSAGWPDYDSLLERVNAPRRQEIHAQAREDAAYKRGLAEARKAAAAGIPFLPNYRNADLGTRPTIETKGKTTRQILDAGLAAALEDNEIFEAK